MISRSIFDAFEYGQKSSRPMPRKNTVTTITVCSGGRVWPLIISILYISNIQLIVTWSHNQINIKYREFFMSLLKGFELFVSRPIVWAKRRG